MGPVKLESSNPTKKQKNICDAIDKTEQMFYNRLYKLKKRMTYPDHTNGVGAPLNWTGLRSSTKS